MLNNILSSIRWRLTAYYTVVLCVILIAFSFYTYKVLARDLRAQFNHAMVRSTEGAITYFENLTAMHASVADSAASTVREFHLANATLAFYRDDSLLAAGDSTIQHNAEVTNILATLRNSRDHIVDSTKAAGLRLVAARVPTNEARVTLVIQEPLTLYTEQVRHLRHLFYIEIPIAIFIAALTGYFLTAQTLRPVAAISQQTESISAQTLHTRLKVENPKDELGQLAGVINALLTRLDDSFAVRKRLVSDASHELRTPLAVVQGESELALSVPRTPSEYQSSLAIIRDQSKRMARVVNDLLVLARSDAGEQALWVEELYLNDVVDECCENARSLARQKSVHLEYEPAPDDIPFRGDQELLRRMTANLVDNAIYYTPAGGRVHVTLASSAQEVRLTVQDTGVGIRSEDIERVFDRFYRTSASRSRSSGGSGLGLSIVKVAAESHLGRVSLTSELHRGSCFVVTLPPSGLAPGAESES